MANALQMYLMSGASAALVTERAAAGAGADPMVESQAFSDTLSDLNQSISLTERQKAAIHTAMHAAEDGENVPDADALKAILVDDDSSASEKDSARAWLAIIQYGKETSAELSSGDSKSTDSKKSQTSSSIVLTVRDLAGQQIGDDEVDSEEGNLAEETEPSVATKNKAESAGHRSAHIKSGSSSSDAIKLQHSTEQDDETSDELDDESRVSDKAEGSASKTKTGHKSAELPNQPVVAKTAVTTKIEQGSEADETAKADATRLVISGASSSINSSSPESGDGRLEQIVVQQHGSAAEAKANATETTEPRVSKDSKQQDVLEQRAQAALESEALQDKGHEGLQLEPRLQTAVRAESNSSQQTLASATQARAEQSQASALSAGHSAGQGSADEKGQRQSSSMSQEQWLQAESAVSKDSETQQNITSQRSFSAAEQQARFAAGLGNITQQGLDAALSTANSTQATAQFVQSQGGAAQPQSAMTQISEMLRQPMNLLAADATGQLRERLVMMARHSIHSAEIKLDPAELGSMTIRVNMQQDQASVQFLVQQAHAKEVLEQQLPRLRDMLQEQGIQLADGQVEQQGSQQPQDQGQGRGQQTADSGDAQSSVPTSISTVSSDRLVDYYA